MDDTAADAILSNVVACLTMEDEGEGARTRSSMARRTMVRKRMTRRTMTRTMTVRRTAALMLLLVNTIL